MTRPDLLPLSYKGIGLRSASFSEGECPPGPNGFRCHKVDCLYADYAAEGTLSLAEYESLGGVQGSIEAAVAAALAEPGRAPAIPADRGAQFAALRAAFIPSLVRIEPQSGTPMRRVARRDEIPEASRTIVERLVEARL